MYLLPEDQRTQRGDAKPASHAVDVTGISAELDLLRVSTLR